MSSTAFRVGRMAGTLRLHAANVHVWRRTLRIFSNAAHTKNRRRRHARTAGKINEGRRALRCIARLCERPLLGIWRGARLPDRHQGESPDLPRHAARRERSEEHTPELQSLMRISYAVLRLQKKNISTTNSSSTQNT